MKEPRTAQSLVVKGRVRHAQTALLTRLSAAKDVDAGYWTGMADCNFRSCGKKHRCKEPCAFGEYRRLMSAAPAIASLFACDRELLEVRLNRRCWDRPFCSLNEVSISAAIKLGRRVLNNLFEPSVAAVGTFKVFPDCKERLWRCEIHMIVGGVNQIKMEHALCRRRGVDLESYDQVRVVAERDSAIAAVLTQDFSRWKHPNDPRDAEPMDGRHYTEFLKWLIRVNLGGRTIRFGCDRYFNRLKNKSQRYRPTPKKRSYPFWLERHMFGNHPFGCECGACGGPLKDRS
jgi:hypothetical protein